MPPSNPADVETFFTSDSNGYAIVQAFIGRSGVEPTVWAVQAYLRKVLKGIWRQDFTVPQVLARKLIDRVRKNQGLAPAPEKQKQERRKERRLEKNIVAQQLRMNKLLLDVNKSN